MNSLRLLAAALGVLALASANATASTDSDSFLVSLRIAAPCDVSTLAAAPGHERVAVSCESPYTPYRLETGARGLVPQAADARMDEGDGYQRMTLTF